MATFSWTSGVSGDWNTGTLWTAVPPTVPPNTAPNAIDADVTIDAANTAYTVTIAGGETETVRSLSMNDTVGRPGTNDAAGYHAAELVLDGTLAFAPGSAGGLDGPLQTYVFTDSGANAAIVNGGTLNAFIQVQGNLVMTGTNAVYITNEIQALGGTVTIDTPIATVTGTTLFDGIFQAKGPGAIMQLGGAGHTVNITKMEGPQDNPTGWTDLTFADPTSRIEEWNGTGYVSIESSLTEISGGGTLDLTFGRNYTTSNTLTIDHLGASVGAGMLYLQGVTVSTAGIDINSGIVQGYGTIASNVANNGTLIALGGAAAGTLAVTGDLTGTGVVLFDTNLEGGTSTDATRGTLVLHGVSAGQTITMNGGDTLELATPGAFAGTIAAHVGDKIVLDGVTATSATLNNGTLVVTNGSAVVASLALSGDYTGESVSAAGSILTIGTAVVAPTIQGTASGQAASDLAPITPFANVVIADPNLGQTETVTVTLSAPANGMLSNLSSGTYDAGTGVYTVTGSPADVTAALKGLLFTPTAHLATVGAPVTTTFTIRDADTVGASASDATTSVIASAPPPVSVNNADGTSSLFVFDPSVGATRTISTYKGPNNTGGKISDIINRSDGTSYLYVYNPTPTASQTFSVWTGTDPSTGAPAGTMTTQVVDKTDGTAAIYQYNPAAGITLNVIEYASFDPTSGTPVGAQISDIQDLANGTSYRYIYHPTDSVAMTFEVWTATDPSNGAPAGALTTKVIDRNDGTASIYQYNPTADVTLNVANFASYDPTTGAPNGVAVSAIVDKADGTSIFYSYNPTATVSQIATFYSATDPSNGAPAGTVTQVVTDYTAGGSAVTIGGTTTFYTGIDGTGTVTSGPPVATVGSGSDNAVISFTGPNQTIDPGAGNHTIQFLAGTPGDTLVLHAGGSDQVYGFDPGAADKLDLRALLSEANINIGGDIAQLSKYISIAESNGSAQVMFDPTGQGGGSQVALLVSDGALVSQLQSFASFKV